MKKAIFVTATGTDIGKTTVSALLMQAGKSAGLAMRYFKPVQTGDCGDCETVKQLVGLSDEEILPPSYAYPQPISPHFAAAMAGDTIEADKILERWHQAPSGYYIIEGAGGLLTPLGNGVLLRDLIKKLNVPILIVASTIVGTINHTLLTIEAIRLAQIPLLGIVLNGNKTIGLEATFSEYANVSVIAHVPPLLQVSSTMISEVATSVFPKNFFNVNGF